MKLLNSVGPNPRKVRMFLLEKGLELPKEDLDLLGGENRRPPYNERNPAGQLPALELDDGTIVCETAAICEYLEELHQEVHDMPDEVRVRMQMRCRNLR